LGQLASGETPHTARPATLLRAAFLPGAVEDMASRLEGTLDPLLERGNHSNLLSGLVESLPI
jgi:hypothetical protein